MARLSRNNWIAVPTTRVYLTREQIKSLCDAAEFAWRKASPRSRYVKFVWGGETYISTLTNLRMLIDTQDGQPVACRYH
jgi:hypothetical protein